ncbi:MAG: Asp-tRNA(Asn)/Glu-tRNA(Gln) amidotransferase subunit GatB [Candidatus Omnitrophota bacterium]|nr:Asp-tRNA(Asn)/Glu-tRNA(Gln) amidotransferase subunit GatB [Candidatus Omnitrophota bacterium]
MSEFQVVIGLEVHLQLFTNTKAFCGCSTAFGKVPNSQTCPVCLGLPGSLPVLNKKVLEYAIKVALALSCQVNEFVKFDRKNYYYPDLPKNYQISQFDLPLANQGFLDIEIKDTVKRIRIRRVHLEEDAGKLIHDENKDFSLVDYNRSGIPLLEIVSEPDINSTQEAYEYLTNLKLILKYLDVSDCDMEKGSLRCDANISLRKFGEKQLGVKAELKNMNSFKAVKQALQFELERQSHLLTNNQTIIQETRLWDAHNQVTVAMRTKEESQDYRYFPEPDLVPFIISKEEIEKIRNSLPESAKQRFLRFIKVYGLSEYDANLLIQDKDLSLYFEECLKLFSQPKRICNWITTSLLSELNSRKLQIRELNLSPDDLVELIKFVDQGRISNLVAKEVLTQMLDNRKKASTIIQEKNLAQLSDVKELESFCEEVIKENPKSIQDFKSGKENALMFLVGCVMRKSQGKANPKIAAEILKRRL